jgi:hypothetical protein
MLLFLFVFDSVDMNYFRFFFLDEVMLGEAL